MDQRTKMESEIQKWQQSGLSQQAFCQSAGLKFSTFCYWRVKLSKEKRGSFVALYPPQAETIELIYPSGVRIKVKASELNTIRQLISLY